MSNESSNLPKPVELPKCSEIAERGIRTSQDTLAFTAAMVADLAAGRMSHAQGQVICNAVGKMNKTAELEAKYGSPDGRGKTLQMVRSIAHEVLATAPIDDKTRALAKLSPQEVKALGLSS